MDEEQTTPSLEDAGEDEQSIDSQEDDGVLLAWDIPEFTKYERGLRWYVIAGVVGFALVLYGLFTANFLFAIIVIMAGIIMFLTSQRDPQMVPFAVTVGGIVIGDHFHPFHEFQNFSVLYEPPAIKTLYLVSGKRARPTIMIPLEDIDPNQVREVFLSFLPEDLDRTEESLTELISRVYKL